MTEVHRKAQTMLTSQIVLLVQLFLLQLMFCCTACAAQSLTAEYAAKHNYPVEEHTLETADGYLINIFRIPYSPYNNVENTSMNRPAVLLLHGFTLTSDAWVINQDVGLPYTLADAGYDVWLGNQRGNPYSRHHRYFDPDEHFQFWNFTWHEIGYHDLSSTIDYILLETKNSKLHYVGFSQGTTSLLVLLSIRADYKQKFETIHLLAPVARMKYSKQPLVHFGKFAYNYLPAIVKYLENKEFLQLTRGYIYNLLCLIGCTKNSWFQKICAWTFEINAGLGSSHTNKDILYDLCLTHPAGSSFKQAVHYIQLLKSAKFQQFDHGTSGNMWQYQQPTPPLYNISSIENCMHLYYGVNDFLSHPKDVEFLATQLPCTTMYRLPFDDWNHYDFFYSKYTRSLLHEQILEKMRSVTPIS